MTADRDKTVELLQRVFGAVEVARDIVERSMGLYVGKDAACGLQVLAGLTEAADALSAVAGALSDELGGASVGPAA